MATDREYLDAWDVARRGPRLERQDAEQLLFRHVQDGPLAAEYARSLPQSMEDANSLAYALKKAVAPANRLGVGVPQGEATGGRRQGLYVNPNMSWYNLPGLRPRQGELPPFILRDLGRQNPVFRAALQILKARLQRHLRPMQMSPRALLMGFEGFDIVRKDRPDYEELSPADQQRRQQLVDFFQNSGDTPRFSGRAENREDLERESLRQVGNLMVEQRYVLDATAVERQLSRNGRRISGYYVMPGETIQRVNPEEWNEKNTPEALVNPTARFAQVIDQQIYTSYGSHDLFYDYTNGSDELNGRGYGMSEVEMSHRISVGILNVLTSNNAIFDRNAIPPIIMQLRGQVSNAQLNEMVEEWNAFRLGAGGEWGLPFFNIKDTKGGLEPIHLKSQPSEMIMHQYAALMIAITASIIGLDASELNATAFGGSASNLGGANGAATKLEDSRNRAFLPMLDRIEENFNLIGSEELGDEWEFRFLGKNRLETELLMKTFRGNMTVDEVRTSLLGLPPLGGLQGGALSENAANSQMALAALKDGMAVMDEQGRLQAVNTSAGEAMGEDKVPEPAARKKGKPARSLQKDD